MRFVKTLGSNASRASRRCAESEEGDALAAERWYIAEGPAAVDVTGDYARGWRWTLWKDGREEDIEVWITGSAWASRDADDLAEEVRDAIDLRGIWVVQRYFSWTDPPRRVEVDVKGPVPVDGTE